MKKLLLLLIISAFSFALCSCAASTMSVPETAAPTVAPQNTSALAEPTLVEKVKFDNEMITGNKLQPTMYLHSRTPIDSDTTIELYIDAMPDEWDDGQLTALLVRKGDDVWPLMPKTYIQGGTVYYQVWTGDAPRNATHVLTMQSFGGIYSFINEYVYDSDADAFLMIEVYTADGNAQFIGSSNDKPIQSPNT